MATLGTRSAGGARNRRRRIALLLLLLLALGWLLLPGGSGLEEGSILEVELAGEFEESSESSLLGRLLGGSARSFAGFLSELRKAERDDRIDAVVFRVRRLGVGWGKAQELRDAIAHLTAAGKRTVAHLELPIGANKEYYVACAASEVHASPASAGSLVGLSAEYLFLGGLWEKLGVGVEVEGVGEYKSAVETLAGTEMSPAHREMATAILDSTNARFIAGIAESRKLEEEFVRRAIDEAPGSAEEMKALHLVDRIAYYDESLEALGDGPVISAEEYAAVAAEEVGFDPEARFALVYGSGSVMMGSATRSRSGAPVLASDTLAEIFEDIAEDEEIDAIIFRIDSPGGDPLAADLVWRAARRARESGKPLVVSVSDMAASGGYYVAAGADAIFAPASSLIGSIGVFLMRPVVGGLLEKLSIGVESMTRGTHADVLLPSKPLSDEARAYLNAEATHTYRLFLDRVASGRDMTTEEVDEVGRGRVWTGEEALRVGLVDGLGGLRTAVADAKRRVGLAPETDVALVPYPKAASLAEQLESALGRFGRGAASGSLPPLPPLAERLGDWIASASGEGPSLIPPFLVEIR